MATPSFLSTPLANGFTITKADPATSFQTDAARTRRRSTFRAQYAPEVLSLSWLLTQAKFDAFVEFFESELLAGSKPFSLQIAGLDTAPKTALFTGPYSAEFDAEVNAYRVSASVVRGLFIGPLNVKVSVPTTVNAAPSGSFSTTITYNEVFTVPIASLMAAVSDAESDPLTFVSATAGEGIYDLVVSGAEIVIRPVWDFVGDATFSFVVTDGTSSPTLTATLSVQYVNDASLRLRMGWGSDYEAPASDAVVLSMASNLGPYIAPPPAS